MQKLVEDKKSELISSINKKLSLINEQLQSRRYSEDFKRVMKEVSAEFSVKQNVTYAAWNSFLTNGNNQQKYIKKIVISILNKLKEVI